jgi:hypothetical protein
VYRFWIDHTGLLGERVTQGWELQRFPPSETWVMTTLRIDPNVEGYPEQEILFEAR